MLQLAYMSTSFISSLERALITRYFNVLMYENIITNFQLFFVFGTTLYKKSFGFDELDEIVPTLDYCLLKYASFRCFKAGETFFILSQIVIAASAGQFRWIGDTYFVFASSSASCRKSSMVRAKFEFYFSTVRCTTM